MGSLVNGQLTTNLLHRLTAIGIPKSFQSEVITAVTTGSFSTQAKNFVGGKAIEAIVNKVVSAAYRRVGHGLDISLTAAGSLMVLSAIVAFTTTRSVGATAATDALDELHDLDT